MGQDRTDKDRTGAQPQHESDGGQGTWAAGLGSSQTTPRGEPSSHMMGEEGAGQLQLVCLPVCSFLLHPTVVGPSPAGLRR